MTPTVNIVNPFQTINWKEFVCGWGAAVMNISITYPINKIIFRQMLHGFSAYQAVLQLHHEGFLYLYRGILPPLCQKTLSMSIMFGVYGASFDFLNEYYQLNIYVNKAISAMLAGTLECSLMPFERIQTILQHKKYHGEYRNMHHAFKEVRQYGFREYYRGFTPILFRNGPSNICFFIIRDEIKMLFPHQNDGSWKSPLIDFGSGAFIGATVSAIFYPLNVVKVSMQEKLGGHFENIFVVFLRIYRERGGKIRNIYHGVGTNCIRAFFSWGVVCLFYEKFRKLLYS